MIRHTPPPPVKPVALEPNHSLYVDIAFHPDISSYSRLQTQAAKENKWNSRDNNNSKSMLLVSSASDSNQAPCCVDDAAPQVLEPEQTLFMDVLFSSPKIGSFKRSSSSSSSSNAPSSSSSSSKEKKSTFEKEELESPLNDCYAQLLHDVVPAHLLKPDREFYVDILFIPDDDDDVSLSYAPPSVAFGKGSEESSSQESDCCHVPHSDDDDCKSRTCSNEGCSLYSPVPAPDERSLRFGKVKIRFHSITLGDNPAVTSGLPLTLDWEHEESVCFDVDDYERLKEYCPKNVMKLPEDYREALLKAQGHSSQTLVLVSQDIEAVKAGRKETLETLIKESKMQEYMMISNVSMRGFNKQEATSQHHPQDHTKACKNSKSGGGAEPPKSKRRTLFLNLGCCFPRKQRKTQQGALHEQGGGNSKHEMNVEMSPSFLQNHAEDLAKTMHSSISSKNAPETGVSTRPTLESLSKSPHSNPRRTWNRLAHRREPEETILFYSLEEPQPLDFTFNEDFMALQKKVFNSKIDGESVVRPPQNKTSIQATDNSAPPGKLDVFPESVERKALDKERLFEFPPEEVYVKKQLKNAKDIGNSKVNELGKRPDEQHEDGLLKIPPEVYIETKHSTKDIIHVKEKNFVDDAIDGKQKSKGAKPKVEQQPAQNEWVHREFKEEVRYLKKTDKAQRVAEKVAKKLLRRRASLGDDRPDSAFAAAKTYSDHSLTPRTILLSPSSRSSDGAEPNNRQEKAAKKLVDQSLNDRVIAARKQQKVELCNSREQWYGTRHSMLIEI